VARGYLRGGDLVNGKALQPKPGWATHSGFAVPPCVSSPDTARIPDRILAAERIYRYGWAYDERDSDALIDCFTEQAVWEGRLMGVDQIGPHKGRGAVVTWLSGFWNEQNDQRRHLFTNVIVDEPCGMEITAHAYLLLASSSGGSTTIVSAGPYRFALACGEDCAWRIARLVGGFDAPF